MEDIKDEVREPEVKDDVLSHMDAMKLVHTELTQLIINDILLSDLPREITVDEVNSQIALEYGQAMTVYVQRQDDQTLPVVVKQDATVLDLKHALRRHVMLRLSREGGPKCISWRHVWRRHWLCFDGTRLDDDRKSLKQYGIYNKCEVSFTKRLQTKQMGVA